MRRVKRMPLPPTALAYLNKMQKHINQKMVDGSCNTTTIWKSSRKNMVEVISVLRLMTGKRERCMYCLDSDGTDIEHFRPKAKFPKRMFRWRNLLLCCSKCNSKKDDKFPMQGNRPLLIDPSKEEPWRYLDFDPDTGNIIARFDLKTNAYFLKGEKTVEVLQLDRREALAAGYIKTYRRLSNKFQRFLNEPNQSADKLIAELQEADDHGLLGWCFIGTGQNEAPFKEIKQKNPLFWQYCLTTFGY